MAYRLHSVVFTDFTEVIVVRDASPPGKLTNINHACNITRVASHFAEFPTVLSEQSDLTLSMCSDQTAAHKLILHLLCIYGSACICFIRCTALQNTAIAVDVA